MSIIGTIHEDVTTDVLGKIGSWQWFITFLATAIMIPALFTQYEDIFMMQPTNVVCIAPQSAVVQNVSLCYDVIENGTTLDKVACNKWHVKLIWLIWLKKSFLVFCQQKLTVLSTAIISRFGLIFGSVIFGLISDSFGRKTAITIDIFMAMVLEIVLTFCDSEGWFRLFVFLKSLFGSANLYMGLLLVCEIASNSWRIILTMICVIPRLLAMVCSVPFINATFNMETCGFMATLLYLACAMILRWLPESPQWLLYNRKIHIAERILQNAAKMNGIPLCEDFKIRPVNYRAYNILDETTTCVGVLTTHNIRTMFFIILSLWTIFHFLWSSLYVRVYTQEKIGDHLVKVFSFVGLFGCLTIIASRRIALKHLLLIHAVLTGAITLMIAFVRNGVFLVVMSSVALSSGLIAHALIFNMTPRLFAINIRASAFGICQASGQLGSITSYFFHLIQPMGDVTYSLVILVAIAALTGLCLVLPNVEGRELPDAMEDMDYYSELSKPLRWATQKASSPSIEEVEIRIHSFGSRRAVSITSNSETRVPAKRIGFSRIWRPVAEYLRRKFERSNFRLAWN